MGALEWGDDSDGVLVVDYFWGVAFKRWLIFWMNAANEMRQCRGRSAESIRRAFFNYNKIYTNRLKINSIYNLWRKKFDRKKIEKI